MSENTDIKGEGTARRVGAGYVAEGLLAHSPTPVAVVPIHPDAVH